MPLIVQGNIRNLKMAVSECHLLCAHIYSLTQCVHVCIMYVSMKHGHGHDMTWQFLNN